MISVRRVLPLFVDVTTNAKGMLVVLDLAGTDLKKAMGTDGEGVLYMGEAGKPRSPREEVQRRLRSITLQLYEGLGWMHSRGVLHQDIKPENLMISEYMEHARITDYGLAGVSQDRRGSVDGREACGQ